MASYRDRMEPAPPEAVSHAVELEQRQPRIPAAAPAQLWRVFDAEQSQRRARNDQLAAGVMMAVLVAARLRTGEHPTTRQEVHSGSVLFLTALTMMYSPVLLQAGQHTLRSCLVMALKLAAATAPLFQLHSYSLFNVYPSQAHPPTVASSLLRIIVADHTALLFLLGTAMPQGLLADGAAQLLFLATLSQQTSMLCDSRYVVVSLKTSWWSFLSKKQACTAFIYAMQLSIGAALPMLLAARREAGAAVAFARQHGISASDCRLRAYTRIHTALGLRLGTWLRSGVAVLCVLWLLLAWTLLAP